VEGTALAALRHALADRYRLERELGQGGMAIVYLAEDVRHHRQVAVKVLRSELAATLGSDRFFREIEVAARLQHPHILPLLDSGEAGGFYFYVMPYIAGESLRERLARVGELPIHDAVKILVEVVDALAAAHAAGVVHRDIKPDNVMLSGRHALVMDFGVAKAVSEATGRNQLTTAGVALGTPEYMAPEQAAADPHLDHRVDIYAVGTMGYELLTGGPPFSGGSSQEILAAHMTRAPEPVSSRRPAVSPALASVIMKCLEKRPADRYQTAEELLAELEPLATPSGGTTPTQTRPVEAVAAKQLPVWAKAAGAVVAGTVVVVAAVLLGIGRDKHTPATLRDRVQLTSTGRVSRPSISPDGKQLAYVVTDCTETRCTYGIEVMDVGGSATRRLLDGATFLEPATWSPDRRSLLFTGTLNGRYGSYLISTLGSSPLLVSPERLARFDASGDSILSGHGARRDSVCWIRIAGLDGVPRDSIRVPGHAGWYAIAGAIPKSPWIVVATFRSGRVEFIALDRNGREGGRSVHLLTGDGWWRVAADALWVWWGGSFFGGDPRAPLIRVPFDARTGRFSAHIDTVYTGRITAFDVTGEGGTVMLDEGSAEFSVWAMNLADALHGSFSDNHRLLRATTPIDAGLAPAGDELLLHRSGGTNARDQLSMIPFAGGAETSVPVSGSLIDWGWAPDPALVAVYERTPEGTAFGLVDRRTGRRRTSFSLPDSGLGGWTALANDGWAWWPLGTKTIRIHRRGESAPRGFPVPRWFEEPRMLTASVDGATLAVTGWGPSPSVDTLGVTVLSLRDGTFTPWVSRSADGGWGKILPDHSMLLQVRETQETVALYRLRGPGKIERLGAIPRPVVRLTVSDDLKRAAIVTRDYHGDAWMYRVVRPAGGSK
jgi:tRNA A-37 threonylcarbamoyl transferase component Bud32